MDKEQIAIVIGEKIKQYRLANGWTQQELGAKIGMSKNAIGNYEKGFRSPKKNTMFDLANAFNVSIDDLFPPIQKDTPPTTSPIQSIYDQLEPPGQGKVLTYAKSQLKEQNNKVITIEEKLFEYRVFEKLSAGTGFSYFNDGNYDTVFYDKDLDHDFASWVFGDSMEPKYMNGEVVLIKETGFDYDGAIYAVDWDGQTYIKKVYKEKDGLRLVSINNKYKDKFAPYNEDPRIIGKIVGNFMPIEN